MALFGIFGGETRSNSLENPSVSLTDENAFRLAFGDTFKGFTDEDVNERTALGVPAIWDAVNFVSGAVASLPLHVYRHGDDGPVKADGDPVYPLLTGTVNDDLLTSFQFRKWLMTRLMLEGRAVVWIERNRANRPMNLWPLDLSTLTIKRVDSRLVYERKRKSGAVDVFAAGEVLDFVWMPAGDGISHINPIQQHRNSIGLTIAAERFAANNFANGGVPTTLFKIPAQNPAAFDRAAAELNAKLYTGGKRSRSGEAIPKEVEVETLGLNHTDLQLIDARKFQITEVARIWNIPPSFLKDLTGGTFNNSEHQDLAFVKHTLTQWLKMIEEELNAKLFGRKSTNYAEFNLAGLLRGDFKTQMEGLRTGVFGGIYTPDEARGYLNLPAKPGGDRLLIQGATVPLTDAGKQVAPSAPTQPNPDQDPAASGEEDQ
ncbi:phage portal protein [Caulobacter sp. UC70_42]|uniref:phage portal protein n=1 Tax=Caulobacter sp. UC70_42 TaxID=3374551 RepID=UPI003756CE72